MRIARFGDTYAAAYTFSLSLMDDEWRSARPPISQVMSGADGAFDYYGSNNFPVAPLVAKKKFGITGTSSADLEDSLNTLRAATIAEDRSKLWWIDRDNSTTFWQYAKCIGLNTSDSYNERGRWIKNVEIEFYCPEGVWYGATEQSESGLITIPAGTINSASENITNDGNYDASLKVNLIPASCAIQQVGVQIHTGGTPVCQWQFNDTIGNGDQFSAAAGTYIITNAGADAYADLDVGDATLIGDPDINQVAWLWLPPGEHTFLIKVDCTTGGGGESVGYLVYWYDTYVF